MIRAVAVIWLLLAGPAAADWRADVVQVLGRVNAIEVDGPAVRVAIGAKWYQLAADALTLEPAKPPVRPALPAGALADGRMATSAGPVAKTWLADPTGRYDHGVLGDAIEAGSLVIERRDGKRGKVTLGADAVFEDLTPRIADIGGIDRIVVVKSYLARGSALAVVDAGTMRIVAETPAIGHPHAWLNPAGVADYDGNGTTDLALVRQPHVVGHLELWSWKDSKLTKVAEVDDVANHFIGSRALGMHWTADFDGDGYPDLAVPSLDRKALRIIGFAPGVRDIARVALPARIVTNLGAVMHNGRLALLAGLEDGRLVMIRP
ncbi:hypothetical protein BH11PSE4_BH11PSE4_04600 [soil metagenome]